jgi:hypothetical protein
VAYIAFSLHRLELQQQYTKMFQYFGSFGSSDINKVGFEDIIDSSKRNDIFLINTLPINEQSYLIKDTLSYELEEKMINDSLQQFDDTKYTIIIYGRNSTDKTIEERYKQLLSLGYSSKNLYIYYGGLFEWSLLKDIYGIAFSTTSEEKDILKYKPEPKLRYNT